MPGYDVSKPRSGGSSPRKTPPPPPSSQNRLPLVGVGVTALILLVIVIAWSLLNGHHDAAPVNTGHRIVIQHDPSSPTDLSTDTPKTPQGTNAIKSMYNINNADPEK